MRARRLMRTLDRVDSVLARAESSFGLQLIASNADGCYMDDDEVTLQTQAFRRPVLKGLRATRAKIVARLKKLGVEVSP